MNDKELDQILRKSLRPEVSEEELEVWDRAPRMESEHTMRKHTIRSVPIPENIQRYLTSAAMLNSWRISVRNTNSWIADRLPKAFWKLCRMAVLALSVRTTLCQANPSFLLVVITQLHGKLHIFSVNSPLSIALLPTNKITLS